MKYTSIGGVGSTQIALCVDDDGEPLGTSSRPEPKVRKARNGRSCGSGSYFISVMNPYLEDVKFLDSYGRESYASTGKFITNTTYWSNRYEVVGAITGPSVQEIVNHDVLIGSGYETAGSDAIKVTFGRYNGDWRWKDMTAHQIMAVRANKTLFMLDLGIYCTSNFGTTWEWPSNPDDPNQVFSAIMHLASLAHADLKPIPDGRRRYYYYYPASNKRYTVAVDCYSLSVIHLDDIQLNWKFDADNDYDYWMWRSIVDLGIIPGDIRNAVSIAYEEATGELPEVSANSLMNVCELASTLCSMSELHKRGMKALADAGRKLLDPKNAWLSYRYVYNTTKMDLNEYKEVTNRLIGLAGQSTFKISGRGAQGAYRAKCTRTMSTFEYDIVEMPWYKLLKTYGFKLSLYNVWDMVPYSFMVDWFIPIGDAIEHMEKWAQTQQLHSLGDWFSVSRQYPHGYSYMRWSGIAPSLPPVYSKHKVSSKTLTYRLADTVAIFG